MAAASALVPALRRQEGPGRPGIYSVRQDMAKDLMGTVRNRGKMGYEIVEFYSPYFGWTRSTRGGSQADGRPRIRCLSTHNGMNAFTADGTGKAIELKRHSGQQVHRPGSAGRAATLDDWKKVADTLNSAHAKMKAAGMQAGYHNHQAEFRTVENRRPNRRHRREYRKEHPAAA